MQPNKDFKGFNASFYDILSKVEPERFQAEIDLANADTADDFDVALVEAKEKGVTSRSGVSYPPPEPVFLPPDKRILHDECMRYMRNFRSKAVLVKRTLYEYEAATRKPDDDENDQRHMETEQFFALLKFCNLYPPNPAHREAITERYSDPDPSINPKRNFHFVDFSINLVPKSWDDREWHEDDTQHESMPKNWRVLELRSRVAERRAHTLIHAGKDAIINQKHFNHAYFAAHEDHGREMMGIVNHQLKCRDLLGQAERQWALTQDMKSLELGLKEKSRGIFETKGRLEDVKERVKDLRYMVSSNGVPRHPHTDAEINVELKAIGKDDRFANRFVRCRRCDKPFVPHLLEEHYPSCKGNQMSEEARERENAVLAAERARKEAERKEAQRSLLGSKKEQQQAELDKIRVEEHAKKSKAREANLGTCKVCGRRVPLGRLEKHEIVCDKKLEAKKYESEQAAKDPNALVGVMAPRCPQNFKVVSEDLTPTTMTLLWEPPIIDGGAPIFDYEVNYSIRTETRVAKTVTYHFAEQPAYSTVRYVTRVPMQQFGTTLKDLKAGATFAKLTVRCRNIVGWSPFSEAIEVVQMPPLEAPGPPLLMTLFPASSPLGENVHLAVTSFSISVTWSAPMFNGGTPIRYYRLQYTVLEENLKKQGPGGAAVWEDVTKTIHIPYDPTASQQTHKIDNVVGDTEYRNICVVCVNTATKGKGDGYFSEPSNAIECVRTPPPTRLQLLQNELSRGRSRSQKWVDAHPEVTGLIQRMDTQHYIQEVIKCLDKELLSMGRSRDKSGVETPSMKRARELEEKHEQARVRRAERELKEKAELLLRQDEEGVDAETTAAQLRALEETQAAAAVDQDQKLATETKDHASLEAQRAASALAQGYGKKGFDDGDGELDSDEEREVAKAEEARLVEEAAEKAKHRGENYEVYPSVPTRRKQFAYRMERVKDQITAAEDRRLECIGQQSLLVHQMQLAAKFIIKIERELDRVTRFTGAAVDSAVLHGKSQRFDKTALRDQLQLELTKQLDFIAQSKRNVIDGRETRKLMETRLEDKRYELNERRAAMLHFEHDAKKGTITAASLQQWNNRTMIKTFVMWRDSVEVRRRTRNIMRKAFKSWTKRELGKAHRKWFNNAHNVKVVKKASEELMANGVVVRSAADRILARVEQ